MHVSTTNISNNNTRALHADSSPAAGSSLQLGNRGVRPQGDDRALETPTPFSFVVYFNFEFVPPFPPSRSLCQCIANEKHECEHEHGDALNSL